MANESSRGKKTRCPKCGGQYYDLGRRNARCPACHKASLIEDGSIAQVRLGIKDGGHNDPEQGWTDGCATRNQAGAVYLNCQFEVLNGKHTGKRFYSLIGLYTPKGPWWGNKGRKTLREILNSAHAISDGDYSPRAINARRLQSLSVFDGMEFFAEISIKKEEGGLDRNELKAPITPDDPRFTELSGSGDAKISQNSEPETDLVSVSDPFDRPGYTPAWLSRV